MRCNGTTVQRYNGKKAKGTGHGAQAQNKKLRLKELEKKTRYTIFKKKLSREWGSFFIIERFNPLTCTVIARGPSVKNLPGGQALAKEPDCREGATKQS